jgi:ribosome recycling factor
MIAEELKTKVEELRTLIAEKLAELEEDPNWASDDEREELVQALDDLVVQGQALSELLQEVK